MIIEKVIITHQEPRESMKVWLLLEYISYILGYPSKYCDCTSKRKLGRFPHSTPAPPVDNFLIFISQKILLNIKDLEFDFRMSCILV